MDAFFSKAEDAIGKEVDFSGCSEPPTVNIEEYFEVKRCVEFIIKNNFKCVALQFPDSLLAYASSVVHLLKNRTNSKLYILADTSYGSCCVDEIAAQHANADAIIHFGRSCLSATGRLPILLIFGCQPIDFDLCERSFREFFTEDQSVLILCDVVYNHLSDDLASRLQNDYANLVVSRINQPSGECIDNRCKTSQCEQTEDSPSDEESISSIGTVYQQFGRSFVLPKEKDISNYIVFYIGGESTTLTNFLMTFNKCKFYSFDPATNLSRRETLDVNRALMKRYYMIEKAKDANVIGIVAGTLGVKDYLSVISRLKALIKRVGKKSYTFVMGKLNVPKMANFTEVDVYVLVACPENSLIDSKEFYRPIITPFEMEIAFNEAREWNGTYITDFRKLLPGADDHVAYGSDDMVKLKTDISLVTGSVRMMGVDEEEELVDSNNALIKRDHALALSNVHVNPGRGRDCNQSLEKLM
ncbi:2-(3-amino-3-carboxypropyl)histidine synthase subunit 2-like isoform X2 [Antedon mediterranea]|uniref:2-(3-amino-3-carboxypropyl)histidine synthase subunit 2-like isoform X2 n=1 Tax=Antedon mediterranea TaxID=105859 RepID=UPI003AF4BE2D